MGKMIPVYFSDEDLEKLQKVVAKEERLTKKPVNVSQLFKRAVFGRRDRKRSLNIPTLDLIFLSQLKSKISSIRGDHQAGRDIGEGLKALEELADKGVNQF